MSVLTVPRSIASSSLKNFSMNFTTTFLLRIGRVTGKRAIQKFRPASRMPRRRFVYVAGDVLVSRKELLRLHFQPRMTTVRDEAWFVRDQRIQDDLITRSRRSSQAKIDRKSTRLNSSHVALSRMP